MMLKKPLIIANVIQKRFGNISVKVVWLPLNPVGNIV